MAWPVGNFSGPQAITNWTRRKKITIKASQIGADMSSPVLFVDLAQMPSTFWSNVQSNGQDIRVTAADETTELEHDVAYINTATSKGALFIRINGTLSSTVDTDIWIYYDHALASAYAPGATYGRNNCWQDYAGVYLPGADGYNSVIDRTGNNASALTAEGSMTSGDEVEEGPFNVALDFDGTDDCLDGGDRHDILASDLYNEAIFYPDQTTNDGTAEGIAGKSNATATDGRYTLYRRTNQTPVGFLWLYDDGAAANISETSGATQSSAWYYAGQRLIRSGFHTAWLDGSQVGSSVSIGSTSYNNTAPYRIGSYDNGFGAAERFFDGRIAFAAVRTSVPSVDDIQSEYNNRSANVSFLDFTIAEEVYSSSGPIFTVTDTDIGCNGEANGQVAVAIDSGTGPYDYVLKDSGGTTVQSSLSNAATSYTFTGLGPDTYSVEVTNSAGTGVQTGIVITDPAPLVIGVTPTAVTCNGGSNGEIGVTFTGGTAPIASVVLKDSGGTVVSTIADPTSPTTFTGLTVDTYTVEVTDANGCLTSDTGEITEPAAIAVTPTITNETALNADDGQISFAITGGTSPYDVSLYTSAGVFVERKTAQTSPVVFTSLAPDTYDAFVNVSAAAETFAGGDVINDWAHRAKVTFQASQITSDLTNYVATIFFDDLPADFFNQVKTDGSDIRFTKGDGFTELEFYVHAIDTVAGTGYASVRYAGTLSSTVNTDIYIYYGNSSASAYADGATYGRNNTFQGYEAFWDFEQGPAGTPPQLVDLTGSGNDGTSQGTMTSGDEVAGKIGNAWDFNGTDDYVDFSWDGITGTAARTYDFLFKIGDKTGTDSFWQIIRNGSDAASPNGSRFDVFIDRGTTAANNGGILLILTGANQTYGSGLDDNAWHHVSIQMGASPTLADVDVVIDGALQSNSISAQTINTTTTTFSLGNESTYIGKAVFWDGQIDAFGAKSTNAGNDFAITQYANQNSPSTFYTVGAQETPQYFASGCNATSLTNIVATFSAGVFGPKYRIEFTSDLNLTDWRIDIEKANYSSTVTSLKAGPNPLRITRGKGGDFDKYIEIYPSTATFEVWVETEAALRELVTENEEEYRIKIYRDPDGTNLLFWVGQFVSDLYQEAYQGTPYLLQLKAVDGLARLKNLEFLDSNDDFIEGNATLYAIIKEALNGLQSYFLADKLIEVLNVWDDNFSQASGQSVLNQTYTDRGAYIKQTEKSKSALSKYNVLKNIVGSFGARLFYEFDTFNETPCFFIQRVNELNQASIARAEINLTTDAITTSNRATVQQLKTKNAIEAASGNVYQEVTFVRADHLLRFGPAVKKVTVRFKPENIKNAVYGNILSGGEFEFRQPQLVNDWDDGAGNDSTTLLRDWTGAGGGVVRQSFAALNYSSEPGAVANAYGAKFATVATQGDITSDAITVNDGFGGATNVLNFSFRFFYLVDAWVVNRDQVTVNPKVQIEIKVGSNYLQNDLTWDTVADFVEFDLGDAALQDINGLTIPAAVTNVAFKADVPSGGGALTVRILQNEANDGSGSIGRIVSLTTSGTAVENTTLVVEFARCTISNSEGEVGSESVEYLATNDINATAEDVEKEYIHGDAADGQGFNAGVYQLASGAPTDSWSRTGQTDNLTLLKFLSRAIINNYDEISLKLEGTFLEGNGKLRFDKIYRLDETINAATVTRYLLPLFIDINFKTEFARCEFVQNLEGFAAYDESEISQPSGAGQIGS